MSCYKSSNNKFFNASARMSDGRNFTDYRPNHEINKHIIDNNSITNMHNYRMFLSRNTDEIIKRNQNYIFLKNGLYNCKQPYAVGTMFPEKTRIVCDAHKCEKVVVNENGFGEGREYVTLKEPNHVLDALNEPELNKDNICADTKDNLHYYPIQRELYTPNELRQAVPGGGDMLSGGDSTIIQ